MASRFQYRDPVIGVLDYIAEVGMLLFYLCFDPI
jgi:hypothetical protein